MLTQPQGPSTFLSTLLLVGTYTTVRLVNKLIMHVEEYRRNISSLDKEYQSKFLQCKRERRYWSSALRKSRHFDTCKELVAQVNLGHANVLNALRLLKAKNVGGVYFDSTRTTRYIDAALCCYERVESIANQMLAHGSIEEEKDQNLVEIG